MFIIKLTLLDHAVNLLLGQTTLVVGDGDRLGLASALIVGRHLEDTIGIKIERDLDLGNTTGRGRNAGKLELAEEVVVLGHRALTLEHLDQDNGLVVGSRREDLALARGNGGVAGDELGHDTTRGLDTEGQRVDVHEDELLSSLLAREDTGLDGGAEGDGLVRVDTLGSLLVEEVLDEGLDLGDTGRATDKDNVVDLILLELGVLEHLLNGLEGLLEEVHVELLELGAGHGLGEVVTLVEGLNLNASRHLRRQAALELLNLTLQLAHGLEVLGDVDVVLLVVGLRGGKVSILSR